MSAVPVLPGVGVCTTKEDVPVPVETPDCTMAFPPFLSVADTVAPLAKKVVLLPAVFAVVVRICQKYPAAPASAKNPFGCAPLEKEERFPRWITLPEEDLKNVATADGVESVVQLPPPGAP